jgi:hypothetical protein
LPADDIKTNKKDEVVIGRNRGIRCTGQGDRQRPVN